MRRVLGLLACLVGCGPLPLEPSEPDPGSAHFTIATFNVEVEHFSDAATVEAVGATHADIICLEEVSTQWESALRARYSAEYPHMLFEPGGSGGLGLLSRWPLAEPSVIPAPHDWHPAWHVLAQTPAGLLEVLVVHLRSLYEGSGGVVDDYTTWQADHRMELEGFVQTMDRAGGAYATQLPRVVLGDFNDGPDSEGLSYLESLGFRNALPLYHPGQFTWRHASLGNQFDEPVDHILFDGSMRPLNAFVVNAGNSDHIPVVAHLQALGTWSAPITRLKTGTQLPVRSAVGDYSISSPPN